MNKTTVLFVEDEDKLREMVAELMELFGLDVTQASNGAEGLEKLRQMVDCAQPPQVIVSDIDMPGSDINGHQLVEEAIKISPSTFIIHISGKKAHEVAHKADIFVTKPFQPAELVYYINAFIARKNS